MIAEQGDYDPQAYAFLLEALVEVEGQAVREFGSLARSRQLVRVLQNAELRAFQASWQDLRDAWVIQFASRFLEANRNDLLWQSLISPPERR